ncbi:hypothetical protein FHX44_114609 [Pseudonocardia hierapolitana]|uniref:Uncharacterized protein n=1 Tax=Pseudonocardia hierapolitana TaxID=1128676 RepID=A0A561SV18_9PSEU|nr:DUF6196 family protein [Pseudonocardia hierapolitana]TWF78686.1 hypothetical protein FHX44_114609 [Pseudonocardia hierapolitana]
MVTVSSEAPAQTEARLRGVFRRSQAVWLPGSWEFVEGAEVAGRDDAIAVIRDEGQVSADGRRQLTEHFTWSSGEGSGTNQLREANA